jgi:hypothetical protein
VQFFFADHTLDTDRRELCRGSEPIAVEPQVFDLLVYLVRHCHRNEVRSDGRAGYGRGMATLPIADIGFRLGLSSTRYGYASASP